METNLEGVLTIKVNGKIEAIVYNDMEKRAQIFYAVKAMGVDDIKRLLDGDKTLPAENNEL